MILENLRLIANISGTVGYRKSEKQVISYNPYHVHRKKENFGPLTNEFSCLISTHPRSAF